MSEPPRETAGRRNVDSGARTPSSSPSHGDCGASVLGSENEPAEENQMKDGARERSSFVKKLTETIRRRMREDVLDKETTMTVERMVVLRLSTKHTNLWTRQLETKRNEIRQLTELLRVDEIKKEIEKESLVKWVKEQITSSQRRRKGGYTRK